MRRMAIAAAILLGVALSWFLFRTERLVYPSPQGVWEGSYRWGRLHKIRVDGNLDGVFEYRATLAPGASLRNIETWHPIRYERDLDGNGTIDVICHIVKVGQLSARVYWIDVDGDGILETVRLDQDGQQLVNEVERRLAVR